jgi:mevalonate kinase
MVRGAHQLFGEPPLSIEALVEKGFALERVFHGNPSGVDHTVIATGGCLRYQRAPEEPRGRLDPITLPRRLRLAIGLAGPHAGTANAVTALQERRRRHPSHHQRLWDAVGAIANDGCLALESGAYGAVGELMDMNQGLLNALGVSTPAIETMCALARERGALGAKLTGAGGGGAVIALVDDDPAPVLRAFEAAGFPAFAATLEPSS